MKVIKHTPENSSNQDMCEPSPFDWSPCYQHPIYIKFKSHNGRKEYRFKAFLESVKYPEDNSYRTFRRVNKDLIDRHAAEEINYENDDDDDDDYLPPTPETSTYSDTSFNDDDDENDNDEENDDDDDDDDYASDQNDDDENDENDDNDDDKSNDENDDVNCTDETIELEEFETQYVPIVSNDEDCYSFTKDLCDELNYENAYLSSIQPA